MNPSLLAHLASPVRLRQLVLRDEHWLDELSGDGSYQVIEGIPLLLPDDRPADWFEEFPEVLFWDRCPEVLSSLADAPAGEWLSRITAVIDADYGRDGVREAIARYAGMSEEERMGSTLQLRASELGPACSTVSQQAIDDCMKYCTLASGQRRLEQVREYMNTWAVHLHDYAELVSEVHGGIVVELGTGAGLGTYAVMESGLGAKHLISLDVDFACVGNAIGLARALGIESQVDAVVANYWFLPFPDGSIDAVVSHYGIDESRETGRGLAEISRVLRSGGAFVSVSRSDPTIRMRKYVGHLGFSDDELRELVDQAHLYPGPERFIEIAGSHGLALQRQSVFAPEGSHERVLFSFVRA